MDAIVDVATLTGAAMRTLGTEIAAVLGNVAGADRSGEGFC